MSASHHHRVRAVLLVHGLEAERRRASGEAGVDVVDLTVRVARIQARLGGMPADGDGWLLAVYDAALAELCTALGVRHALIDERVCSEEERRRVELELLSSVLPFR